MKRFLNSRAFIFVLGLIITCSVGVYASVKIQASDIFYKDTPLDQVLNDLYHKANNNVNDDDNFCKKITGNKNTIGSEYVCDPGDGIYRVFYVFKVNDNTVDLIMDRNINKGTINWNSAMQYIANNNLKTSWSNVQDISIPKAQDVANAVGNTSWDVSTTANSFYFDKYNGNYQNVTQVANSTNRSAYGWLYGHTIECENYGCPLNTSLDSTAAYGYWLQEKVYNDSNKVWIVNRTGRIASTSSSDYGVRLVVTVLKSNLY